MIGLVSSILCEPKKWRSELTATVSNEDPSTLAMCSTLDCFTSWYMRTTELTSIYHEPTVNKIGHVQNDMLIESAAVFFEGENVWLNIIVVISLKGPDRVVLVTFEDWNWHNLNRRCVKISGAGCEKMDVTSFSGLLTYGADCMTHPLGPFAW